MPSRLIRALFLLAASTQLLVRCVEDRPQPHIPGTGSRGAPIEAEAVFMLDGAMWRVYQAPNGRLYYHDAASGTTQWADPRKLAQQEDSRLAAFLLFISPFVGMLVLGGAYVTYIYVTHPERLKPASKRKGRQTPAPTSPAKAVSSPAKAEPTSKASAKAGRGKGAAGSPGTAAGGPGTHMNGTANGVANGVVNGTASSKGKAE